MKRKRIIIVLCFFAMVVALMLWLLKSSPKPASATASQSPTVAAVAQGSPALAAPLPPIEERRKAVVEQIQSVLATPITFYGKVIDQNGDPVPDAVVGYSALDKFMEPGAGYTGTSDENGTFSISGIKGARLSVNVRKKGYYFIDGKSNAAFAYATGADGYFKNPPVQGNPAIFVLHKMGDLVPLVQLSRRQVDVPKTGAPLSIDLTTGRIGGKDLTLESWTGAKELNRFDWSYRLSVSEGGLVERKGEFDFEAPADGYHPQIEVKMPADAPQWSSRLSKQYFAKLPGDRYARFSIRFYPGVKDDGADRNFVVLESYVNPKPGSRNLEFDPSKVVKP